MYAECDNCHFKPGTRICKPTRILKMQSVWNTLRANEQIWPIAIMAWVRLLWEFHQNPLNVRSGSRNCMGTGNALSQFWIVSMSNTCYETCSYGMSLISSCHVFARIPNTLRPENYPLTRTHLDPVTPSQARVRQATPQHLHYNARVEVVNPWCYKHPDMPKSRSRLPILG
jgi:hypothetical protein